MVVVFGSCFRFGGGGVARYDSRVPPIEVREDLDGISHRLIVPALPGYTNNLSEFKKFEVAVGCKPCSTKCPSGVPYGKL